MAPRLSARLPLAAVLLLLTALWAVPVFVLPARQSGAAGALEPRGSAPASASRSSAGASEPPTGSAGLASLGLVALTLAAGMGRPRQQLATPRQFFGGASAPPPSKPTSYKDFQDPWLGSADLSFDPLNLAVQGGIFDTAPTAVPATTYYNYRESEVKHGRFAMTAFLAIFGESADRGALLRQMGNVGIEDKLDGTLGLDEVQLPILLIGLGYQALAEYNLQRDEDDGNILSVEYKKERMPGDLGFDPLGLSKGQGADIKGLHNIEVNVGRLAMIGITTFLLKEFALKDPEIAAKLG